MEKPKTRQELQLELADARVEYAEGLRHIVLIKRELAYRTFRAVRGELIVVEPQELEHSYGEHEMNIADKLDNENIIRGEN